MTTTAPPISEAIMDEGDAPRPEAEEIRLWDLPTRLFHWALALFFATSWILGEWGPAIMTWHFWSGYAIAGLLAFRLLWGLVGPRPARFSSFLRPPGAVFAYARTLLRREPSAWPGHNPMGGWWVAAILALLTLQVLTGLVSDPEDFINVGPLAGSVPDSVSRFALGWHHRLSGVLLAMVALHVAAVVFYKRWKREDLIRPMIHGCKRVRRD
jgi:cytochrome b